MLKLCTPTGHDKLLFLYFQISAKQKSNRFTEWRVTHVLPTHPRNALHLRGALIDVKGREFWANCSRNIFPEEYFFREESSAVTLFRAKNSWRNIFRNKISRISQEYYSQQGIVFPRIPRNIIPELFFPELKFLWGSGSKSSRNFFPDHLTPLRKINSLRIYVPCAPRNVYSCLC